MYVVDASILVKWFLPESDSDLALQLKTAHLHGTYTLVVPDLALYETLNALRYRPHVTSDDLASYVHALYDIGLDIVEPLPETLAAAGQLALRYHLTIYDACYVALAQSLGLRYVTADRRLVDRLSTLSFVHMLTDLTSH